jgi:hypothetical protein
VVDGSSSNCLTWLIRAFTSACFGVHSQCVEKSLCKERLEMLIVFSKSRMPRNSCTGHESAVNTGLRRLISHRHSIAWLNPRAMSDKTPTAGQYQKGIFRFRKIAKPRQIFCQEIIRRIFMKFQSLASARRRYNPAEQLP